MMELKLHRQPRNRSTPKKDKMARKCLAATHAVTAALLAHTDIDQLTAELLKLLVGETDADRAFWIDCRREAPMWHITACDSQSRTDPPGPSAVRLENPVSTWMTALATGQTIMGRRRDFNRAEKDFLKRLGVETVCLVAVGSGETLQGIFCLGYRADHFPISESEAALLRVSADALTFAFQHHVSQQDKARLEQQIQQSQKMESLGELSSGISHNFRNILAGIIANCQLVQMKYHDHKEMIKSISGILHLAEIGSELVNKLLKFSRKGTKEQKRIFNLADILDETHQIISTSFDKRIELRRNWDSAMPVEGVRSDLSQLLMNLCTNARDAMPNGGILQISAREEKVKERIYLSISDTGSGMDETVRKKIFDPFFTTKEPGKGTGLGLSTAYGIVKDHGGEIHVTSTPGVGTIFQILLPMAKAKGFEQEKFIEPITEGQGETILLVDDDTALLATVKDLLDRIGYRTETADNGKTGIEKYFAAQPEVVLIDRNMPEIDGVTAANHILEVDPEAKIIIVSGYEDEGPDGIEGPVRDAIKAYIIKPFDISELSCLLSGVIAG
jgi:signal transduction histidine kinase